MKLKRFNENVDNGIMKSADYILNYLKDRNIEIEKSMSNFKSNEITEEEFKGEMSHLLMDCIKNKVEIYAWEYFDYSD